MDQQSNGENERQQSRYNYKRIPGLLTWSWSAQNEQRPITAFLHDTSTSGLGMLFPGDHTPPSGQTGHLVCNETGLDITCEVVHATPWYDGEYTLVGCRILPRSA